MSIPRIVSLLVLTTLFQLCRGDIGTAAHYGPPYTPTACLSGAALQVLLTNQFAAAGEGIWDNGAACGRQYEVRCISVAPPGACTNPAQTVRVSIVDRASTSVSKPSSGGATMVLSATVFGTLASISAPSINIEFKEA